MQSYILFNEAAAGQPPLINTLLPIIQVYCTLISPVRLKTSMNRISPGKLLMTKWSAVEPKLKERHFIVTRLVRNEAGTIIACQLEAVINKNVYQIDWQELKDSTLWIMGWK